MRTYLLLTVRHTSKFCAFTIHQRLPGQAGLTRCSAQMELTGCLFLHGPPSHQCPSMLRVSHSSLPLCKPTDFRTAQSGSSGGQEAASGRWLLSPLQFYGRRCTLSSYKKMCPRGRGTLWLDLENISIEPSDAAPWCKVPGHTAHFLSF